MTPEMSTALLIGVSALAGFLVAFLVHLKWRSRLLLNLLRYSRLARRWADDNFSETNLQTSSPELRVMVSAMNRVATTLQRRKSEIERERTDAAAILENMSEGVIALDAEKRILIINPCAERMLGIRHHQANGKLLVEAVRNAKINEMADRAIQDGSTQAKDVNFFHIGEKTLTVHVNGMLKSNGSLRGVIVLYDVTELRRLENVRREFVANVSHELRTPLTSISGFIETLLGGALSDQEKSRSFLKMMEEDSQRLARLIDDLLELSKIESKEIALNLERVNLSELKADAEKVMTNLRQQAGTKKVEIINQIQEEQHVHVSIDRDRMQQVFVNLLDNAIKFNKENGTVMISSQVNPREIKITIKDTGVGIPEEDITRVFERFFRVDKARSRELGGTGLGLSIVKHIIEAHDGTVSCESRFGSGSTFSFTLPTAV